jgi:hypothetical protein
MVTRRAFVGGLLGVVATLCASPALEAAPAASTVPVEPAGYGEAFMVGDVFTIEGRYAVNPITQRSTGVLQRFVVTETSTAGKLAAEPWRVYPRLIDAGPYRNVNDAGPFQASDVRREAPVGLQFHPAAFSMTMQPLGVRVLH